jgi:hypothetical protein
LTLKIVELVGELLSEVLHLLFLENLGLIEILFVDQLQELLIPVKSQRRQFLHGELVYELFLWRHLFKKNALLDNDVVALLDVVDLGVVLIHLVLGGVDLLFVCVSEPFVFRPGCQRKICVVQILKIDLICHLNCASRYRKALIDLVIAGVCNLFEGHVLGVIPSLQ